MSRPFVVALTAGSVLTGTVVVAAGVASAACDPLDVLCQVGVTPSGSASASASATPTATATSTATSTATASATATSSASATPSATASATCAPLDVVCQLGGGGSSASPTATATGTATPTATTSATATPTATGTATSTATPTATGTASPTPTQTAGADGLYAYPRSSCAEFTDSATDGAEDEVDVTQVNLKSPADSLQVFIKVVDLSASPMSPTTTASYSASFTVLGKKITVTADADGAADATVGTTASTTLGATAKLDTANDTVVFTVPKSGIQTATGGTLAAGTPVTGTTVVTTLEDPLPVFAGDGDTATGTTDDEKTYSYGDNTCFTPPPAVLSFAGANAGVYSDKAPVVVYAKTVSGDPIAGVKLGVGLGGGTRATVVTTNSDGAAAVALPVLVGAGNRTLSAFFPGNSVAGRAVTSKAFSVRAESTVLSVTPGAGTVTAKLTDNDRTALASRIVVFSYGRTVVRVRAGSTGVVVLRNQPKGRVVRASFPGVGGLYSAARAVQTTVR